MDQFRADLRTAVRALARRPGSALLVILTLAVGISTNTVMFSLFNGLLFKGAPYPARDRLAWIYAQQPANQYGDLTFAEYEALRDAAQSFDRLAVESRQSLTVTRNGRDEQTWALIVSDNYFATLGTTARRGRVFGEADAVSRIGLGRGSGGASAGSSSGSSGGAASIVVTESFWRKLFGDEASVDGKSVTLNGRTFAIAGVVPDGSRGFGGIFAPELWAPLSALDTLGLRALLSEDTGWLMAAGHLAPGVSQAQAREELKALATQIPIAERLRTRGGAATRTFASFPMDRANPQTAALRPFSLVAMSGVGLVLLLACFNVAGVLLARAHERQREMGLRAALGATTMRLARQQMTELLVLASISGAAALVVGAWSYQLLQAFRLPSPIPQTVDMSLDWRMALFTIALVLLATIVPGFAPIWQSRALDVVRVLKADGRSSPVLRSPLRRGLLLAQIAGSTLLLALAGLLLESFVRVSASDPGFETREAIVLDLDPGRYGVTGAAAEAYVDAALARLRATPGVRAAAVTTRAPLAMGGDPVVPLAAGNEDCAHTNCPTAGLITVGADYFDAAGITLVAGDGFSLRDAAAAPRESVVVSARVAATLWPGRNPVGAWLRIGGSGNEVGSGNESSRNAQSSDKASIAGGNGQSGSAGDGAAAGADSGAGSGAGAGASTGTATTTGTLVQVRGVVREANHISAVDDRRGEIYRLMTSDDERRGLQIIVRTAGDPAPLLDRVRDAMRAPGASGHQGHSNNVGGADDSRTNELANAATAGGDEGRDGRAAAFANATPRAGGGGVPLDRIQTMSAHLELPYWWSRTLAGFSLTCASIAVLLATVGLFGVVHRNVGQRQYEFGVRQALGAAPGALVRLVLTEGLRLAVPGVAAGIATAVLLAHAARSLMPAVDVASPWIYAAVALLQAAATIAACLAPARRAAAVDPLRVLRAD